MTTRRLILLLVVCVCMALPGVAGERHRLGLGVHYLRVVEDIDVGDVESDALATVVSYQYRPFPLLGLEADLEIVPKEFLGGTEPTYAPQAFVLVGSAIYVGLGAGINYVDGDVADDPFYAVRVGLDLEFLPRIHLDLALNYRFVDWELVGDLDDEIDTDTITAGGALRIAF